MFRAIRRVIIVIVFGLVAAGAVVAYQHREVFQPPIDYYTLWRERGDLQPKIVGHLKGQVTSVVNGDTFRLKDEEGHGYVIRLAGIEAPDWRRARDPVKRELAGSSKTNLISLLMSNQVEIDLTFKTPRRIGIGVAHLGETNVNLNVAQTGWAAVNRDYIKCLPLNDQYALVRAEREAQDQRRGIWK